MHQLLVLVTPSLTIHDTFALLMVRLAPARRVEPVPIDCWLDDDDGGGGDEEATVDIPERAYPD